MVLCFEVRPILFGSTLFVSFEYLFKRIVCTCACCSQDLPLEKQFQIAMSFLAVFETPSATHPLIDHVTKVDWLIPGTAQFARKRGVLADMPFYATRNFGCETRRKMDGWLNLSNYCTRDCD